MKNRQILVVCEPCGYKLRGSRLVLARGLPSCGVCGHKMRYADPEQAKHTRPPKELKA